MWGLYSGLTAEGRFEDFQLALEEGGQFDVLKAPWLFSIDYLIWWTHIYEKSITLIEGRPADHPHSAILFAGSALKAPSFVFWAEAAVAAMRRVMPAKESRRGIFMRKIFTHGMGQRQTLPSGL
jgi:hypothetical protein